MTDSNRLEPDPAVARVWARRATELARVPPQRQEGEHLDLLVFCLGSETYGFEARFASDIRPAPIITRVPRVPAYVTGVVHLRGRILSVLDLARFLGLADRESDRQQPPRHLLVAEQPGMELALLVDEVLAVQSVPSSHLQPAGDTLSSLPGEYVRGVVEGSALVVLDLPALLADKRLIVREEMAWTMTSGMQEKLP